MAAEAAHPLMSFTAGYLTAGPRPLQGFEHEVLELFVHPRWSQIDVEDDKPDGLSNVCAVRIAYLKSRAPEVKDRSHDAGAGRH
jgi:hypothetical protein